MLHLSGFDVLLKEEKNYRKCENCGKVNAEPKELIRLMKNEREKNRRIEPQSRDSNGLLTLSVDEFRQSNFPREREDF